jgi:hypothetical protein
MLLLLTVTRVLNSAAIAPPCYTTQCSNALGDLRISDMSSHDTLMTRKLCNQLTIQLMMCQVTGGVSGCARLLTLLEALLVYISLLVTPKVLPELKNTAPP